MRRLILLLIMILFLALSHDSILAASMRIPLMKLAPVQDHQLRGSMDNYNFAIPIPERWKVIWPGRYETTPSHLQR